MIPAGLPPAAKAEKRNGMTAPVMPFSVCMGRRGSGGQAGGGLGIGGDPVRHVFLEAAVEELVVVDVERSFRQRSTIIVSIPGAFCSPGMEIPAYKKLFIPFRRPPFADGRRKGAKRLDRTGAKP